jgi:hypothetical protein
MPELPLARTGPLCEQCVNIRQRIDDVTSPDPFYDTGSQRGATGMNVGARKLVVNVMASTADPSLIVHYLFAGQFADLDDYLDAVEEVWGYAAAQSLREVVADARSAAASNHLTLSSSAGRLVENAVMKELLLHMPEPDFRKAVSEAARKTLKAGVLAPKLTEACRNRGIPWEFDSDEGFRWIGDRDVESQAIRPALPAEN